MIRELDLLGLEPKLYLHSKAHHKTPFGGILTFIVVSLASTLIIYFFQLMIARKQMNLVYNPKNIYRPQINFTNRPFIFNVVDGKGAVIPSDRTWNFYSALLFYYADAQGVASFNRTEVKLEKCDWNKSFGEYVKYVTFSSGLGWCLPRDFQIKVGGKFGIGEPGYYIWDTFVNTCVNTTTVKDCYDQDTINKKLANANFYFAYMDVFFNHDNVTDPVVPFWSQNSLPITTGIYYKYYYNFKQGVYTTDYGFIFESHSNQTFYMTDDSQIYNYPASFGNQTVSNQTNIAQLIVEPTEKYDQYTRSYIKLQEVLANVGGAVKTLTLGARALIYVFTLNTFLSDISGSLHKERKTLEARIPTDMSMSVINKTSNQLKENDTASEMTQTPQIRNFKKKNKFHG
jgi:hypothetical protein